MEDMTVTLANDRLHQLEQKLAGGHASEVDVTHFLVTHYYESLVRLALSITNQPDEAADVAQKTVIKAAEKISQYRPGTNFKAWVFKIGVNEARTALRRKKTGQRLQQILTLGLKTASSPPQPEAQIILNERDQAIWDGVAQLPNKQKLPILLRYSFDLTDQEIGEILDIPHGTVRSRLHTAHKKLFVILGPQEVTK